MDLKKISELPSAEIKKSIDANNEKNLSAIKTLKT